MNALKLGILSGAIALAILNTVLSLKAQTAASPSMDASNTDLPDGTMPGHPYATPIGADVYLGFDVGAAIQHNITLSDTVGDKETVAFDTGVRLDAQFGYNFARHWSTELELGVIISPVKYSYALDTDYRDVDLIELPLMVNLIYSEPLGPRCSVYVGGGVGGIFIHYEDQYNNTTPSASLFGYQGLAGIRFVLGRNWDMGVGYKFLATTSGYDVASGVAYDGITPTKYRSDANMTHSILLTFTCWF